MSDLVWQALIAGIVTIALAYMQMRTKNAVDSASADRKAEAAAATSKAEEVRATLESSKIDTDAKLGEIHTLVNSNMERQLRLTAAALRRIANLTKDPKDKKAAVLAEDLLQEHIKKQAIVDRGNGAE